MARRLSFGHYHAASSPIHALDPRAKILCALACMIGVFFIDTPLKLALGYGFVVFAVALANVPLPKLLRSVKPIAAVVLVLSVFNLLVNRDGAVVLDLGFLSITSGGVRAALLYSLRLIIGVIAALLLLFTTTPTQITDGCDALLSPLAKIGLPAHELAMVFSLMLRFIPTIADEAGAIVDAQAARGGAIGEGSLFARVRAVAPILISLLASSVHHAANLSRALDARCYISAGQRSHWHPLKFQVADAVAALLTAALVVLLVVL